MKILVTGKAGTGKSATLQAVQMENIYFADEFVKKHLYNKSKKIKSFIFKRYPSVKNKEQIDTKKLGQILFNDQRELDLIAQQVAPYVKEWINNLPPNSVIEMGSYLNYQGLYQACFDKIILFKRAQADLTKFNHVKKNFQPIIGELSSPDFVINNDDHLNVAVKKFQKILSMLRDEKISFSKKYFPSPTKKDEQREVLVLKYGHITNKSPIFFFYDGQILKTNIYQFNNDKGIDIFAHLANNNIDNYVLLAVNSMDENDPHKWATRIKELTYQVHHAYTFWDEVKGMINHFKKIFMGQWFGFGFSLSAALISEQSASFDFINMISPVWLDKFKMHKHAQKNGVVFFGKHEYNGKKQQQFLNNITRFKKLNEHFLYVSYKKLVHDFKSWNEHFDHIIKVGIIAQIILAKYHVKKCVYINDSSNINILGQNYQYKMKYNQARSFNNEWAAIKLTHYKDDYQKVGDFAYLKKAYPGQRIDKVNNEQIASFVVQIKMLHTIKIRPTFEQFIYHNEILDQGPKVYSHGDINSKNMIFNGNFCYLIDFEWTMVHNLYFDLVTFTQFFNLTSDQEQLLYDLYGIEPDWKQIREMRKFLKKLSHDFNKNFPNYFITE